MKRSLSRILIGFVVDSFYYFSIILLVVDIVFLLVILFFNDVKVTSNQVWLNMGVGPLMFLLVRYFRRRLK